MARAGDVSEWLKKKGRELAERIHYFGWPPGLQDSYEVHLMLLLNTRRMLWKKAAAHLLALRWARSTQLPLEFFDALAATVDEAEAMQYDVNAEAVVNEARNRYGR